MLLGLWYHRKVIGTNKTQEKDTATACFVFILSLQLSVSMYGTSGSLHMSNMAAAAFVMSHIAAADTLRLGGTISTLAFANSDRIS